MSNDPEEHSEPYEGQEEYQEDRVADEEVRVGTAETFAAEMNARLDARTEEVEARAEALENKRVRRAEQTEERRIVRADSLEKLVKEKERTHRKIARQQLAAFILILAVSLLGWHQIEKESNQRCQAGRVNRQALIDNVYAIETLGTNLVLGSTNPNAPTPEQQKALDQFAQFRKAQLAKLADPICGGKVDLSPPSQR